MNDHGKNFVLILTCIPLLFCIAHHQTMNQRDTPTVGTC